SGPGPVSGRFHCKDTARYNRIPAVRILRSYSDPDVSEKPSPSSDRSVRLKKCVLLYVRSIPQGNDNTGEAWLSPLLKCLSRPTSEPPFIKFHYIGLL